MQVDFYLLSTSDERNCDLFLCRLTEKIYRQKHQLHIHCKDRQEAHRLDELLWTFSDISFIPHNLFGEGPNTPPPIQLGFDSKPTSNDVLINLSTTIPTFHSRFRRVLEIIPQNEDWQVIAQEHEQFYQSKNWAIKSHKIA